MRPKGAHLSYREERDKELYTAFKAALPNFQRPNGTYDINAACSAAIATPCSRYWISEGIAYNMIRMISDDPSRLNTMHAQKRLLYTSLLDTYRRLRDDPSNADLSNVQVAYLASDEPAPSFFMGVSNAIQIIQRMRRIRTQR